MQVLSRIVPCAIFMTSLIDLARPPEADAASCPCTSNSPIVNPFPYRSLRWGTSQVLRGTDHCDKTKMKDPRIAIAKIEDHDPLVRGYQLEVVDRGNPSAKPCSGTQLAGVVFNHLFTPNDEPVVIRQVALAKVTPDIPGTQACVLDEYRIVYLIASVHRPDDSVCTHDLHNGKLHRGYRRLTGFKLPDLMSPEISPKVSDLPLVLPDQLENYVVVMPDADYDTDGEPQTEPPVAGEPLQGTDPALEWYELACGGGALAHTDLSGLVELGEPKEVRTAALRMLRANYRGNLTETLDGIPISFQRDKQHTSEYEALCEASRSAGVAKPTAGSADKTDTNGARDVAAATKVTLIGDKDVEARWAATGAVCVTRSRLWRADGVVTAAQRYHGKTLKDREIEFMKAIQNIRASDDKPGHPPLIPHLDFPCPAGAKNDPRVWFTSGVLHHIADR